MSKFFRNFEIACLALILAVVIPLISSTRAEKTPTLPLPGHIKKDFSAEVRPADFIGALDIRVHPEEGKLKPPAALLLTDPTGRRIGSDPRTGQTYQEIPQASFEFEGIADAVSGAPGPASGIIHIRNPVNGIYTLEIIGEDSGHYFLEIMGYDRDMRPSKLQGKKTEITRGTAQNYSFIYNNKAGAPSVVPQKSSNLSR
jgi:hypothetical protein